MVRADIAALLALCAALASAVGGVIRQRSAQEITEQQVGHLELFRMSLRDPRWWWGGLAAVVNYGLQAIALGLGSVMLVTALQVTTLLFALPISARLTDHPVTRREWIWAALLAAALAVVVTVGEPTAGHARGSLAAWIVVAIVMGPPLGMCVLGARTWAGRPAAAVLLAVVAGSTLAVFAVLTKGVVEVMGHGFAAVVRAPELYAWLVVALVSMVFQQSAFHAGALTASLPTMVIAKPTVASLLGVTVLGETLRANGEEICVVAAAAAVVVVATMALARGEAATMTVGSGHDLKVTGQPPAQSDV